MSSVRLVSLGFAVLAITVGATLYAGAESATAVSERFWAIPRLRGQEVESFDSLQAMAKSADVVVVGRISSVTPSRIIQAAPSDRATGPDSGDAWYAGYAAVEIAVELASPTTGAYSFEVFLSTESKYQEFLNAPLPPGRSIFFLRSKEAAALAAGWSAESASAERSYYMLVNSEQGAIHDFDGGAHMIDEDSDGFARRVNGASFEAVLDEVIRSRE